MIGFSAAAADPIFIHPTPGMISAHTVRDTSRRSRIRSEGREVWDAVLRSRLEHKLSCMNAISSMAGVDGWKADGMIAGGDCQWPG